MILHGTLVALFSLTDKLWWLLLMVVLEFGACGIWSKGEPDISLGIPWGGPE